MMTKEELYRMRDLQKIIKEKTKQYEEMIEQIYSPQTAHSTFNKIRPYNTVTIRELEAQITKDKLERVELMKKFYTWQPTINDVFFKIILELYFVYGDPFNKIPGLIGKPNHKVSNFIDSKLKTTDIKSM